MRIRLTLLSFLAVLPSPEAWASPDPAALAKVERIFADWRLDAHVPGLVYGIVKDGKLVTVTGLGVQDIEAKRAVTTDSLFRIASMSKAFTALAILKLRDTGKLSLDAPAETYVPEMRGWKYPTTDARKIRVRDLLTHNAGFVTDDPWGDRHQPLLDADFTAMLDAGVPFSRQPGIAHEYSNFGYATLGRIISNVSGMRFQDYIRTNIMTPLGMNSTGYDIFKSPTDRRAIGYRWQDGEWLREPDMSDGVFGAMGGVETSAKDYARWVAFLLAAWPPRDDLDNGPLPRATVREIAEGGNQVQAVMRGSAISATPCRQARAYGMGWRILEDCDLGRVITHSGGYPGYGSNVLLLPEKGIGIFAFTNRTYSGVSSAVFKAALALVAAGDYPDRTVPVSQYLVAGYAGAKAIWAAGGISGSEAGLAMNFILDRDPSHWASKLAGLKLEVGYCSATESVKAVTAMEGKFSWTCEHGRIEGRLLMSPDRKPTLQELVFETAEP